MKSTREWFEERGCKLVEDERSGRTYVHHHERGGDHAIAWFTGKRIHVFPHFPWRKEIRDFVNR